MKYIKPKRNVPEELVNENIKFHEGLVISPEGEQLGVMDRRKAIQTAADLGLDLYCVAPNAKPPVCKILDFGRYHFNEQKKAREAKKKQHTTEIKELRLSPNIDTNDLNTKVSAARKFLAKGDRVKFTLRFRGREMAHMSASKHILDDVAELLKDVATVEKAPKVEGRTMTMFLTKR